MASATPQGTYLRLLCVGRSHNHVFASLPTLLLTACRMVLGDHGVGYLYRYWNNRLTERKSQSKWDGTGSSGSAA